MRAWAKRDAVWLARSRFGFVPLRPILLERDRKQLGPHQHCAWTTWTLVGSFKSPTYYSVLSMYLSGRFSHFNNKFLNRALSVTNHTESRTFEAAVPKYSASTVSWTPRTPESWRAIRRPRHQCTAGVRKFHRTRICSATGTCRCMNCPTTGSEPIRQLLHSCKM